jgi:non-canonical (house-cleaning) NTP pyrophosphatase
MPPFQHETVAVRGKRKPIEQAFQRIADEHDVEDAAVAPGEVEQPVLDRCRAIDRLPSH